MKHRRWQLPSVHRILEDVAIERYEPSLGRDNLKRAVERVLDRARASDAEPAYEAIVIAVAERLDELALNGLSRTINATGIIVHTNLGRAPLAAEALDAIAEVARGYSNLEYDLEAGERGSRYARVGAILNDVTGAQDSLVVNNCAAAVLLVLDTFAKGREVVVARNQLVEIGGGFRIPEVLERSGATLVEAGTTNRVYIEDFERALSPRTALLLRTHASNYRIEGFTHDAGARELVELGRRAGVVVAEDLGSGALVDLAEYGVERERTVQDALADGIGLVTFSGDKLLGGPQAGMIVGRANLVARLRSNPLLRALRVDKMTLAALAATLQIYRAGSARDRDSDPAHAGGQPRRAARPRRCLRRRGARLDRRREQRLHRRRRAAAGARSLYRRRDPDGQTGSARHEAASRDAGRRGAHRRRATAARSPHDRAVRGSRRNRRPRGAMSEDGRRVVAFYEGSAPDDRGRFHEDVLRFDDEKLEYVPRLHSVALPAPGAQRKLAAGGKP